MSLYLIGKGAAVAADHRYAMDDYGQSTSRHSASHSRQPAEGLEHEPRMTTAPTCPGAAPSLQKKLVALARKRLRQFATLTPEFLVSDHPDIVHDLRVASRRLQQALRALYSGSKPPKSKKVIRML